MVIKTSKGDRRRCSLYTSAELYLRVQKLKIENLYSVNEKMNWLIENSVKSIEDSKRKY